MVPSQHSQLPCLFCFVFVFVQFYRICVFVYLSIHIRFLFGPALLSLHVNELN